MTNPRSLDQLLELLRQRRTYEDEAIGPDDRLDDLGLDSIDLAYLLAAFERAHNADLSDDYFDLQRYGTVRDLAEALDATTG
jgi:acyl carrier protein